MKASARSGSPARSSTASRITCISLRRMGTVIGSLKASAGHARQRSSLPSRTCRHQAPPPRKNRDKQKGPRYRGPFCLHPCCTFAPANRCNNSPALTPWDVSTSALKGKLPAGDCLNIVGTKGRVDWGLVLRDLDSSAARCSPVIAASGVAMSSKRASAPTSPPHSIGIALATMEPARIGFGVDKACRKRQSQHP
jgi:hypothetical protein